MNTLKTWIALGVGVGMLAAIANAVPPGTTDEIRQRVQPFGELCRTGMDCGQAAAAAASGPLTGEQVYTQYCFACHAVGVGGAPKYGSAADWDPRMAQGVDTLAQHTLNGIRAMPAKGTCMSCSEDELRGAMQYMVDSAKAAQ